MGSPSWTVRPTVHSRSRVCASDRGSTARAASPSSPAGKLTSKVTDRSTRWLPCVVAHLVAARGDRERLRARALAGDRVDVGGAAPRDGGQQQLHRGEVGVLSPAPDEGLTAAGVDRLPAALPDLGELDRAEGLAAGRSWRASLPEPARGPAPPAPGAAQRRNGGAARRYGGRGGRPPAPAPRSRSSARSRSEWLRPSTIPKDRYCVLMVFHLPSTRSGSVRVLTCM